MNTTEISFTFIEAGGRQNTTNANNMFGFFFFFHNVSKPICQSFGHFVDLVELILDQSDCFYDSRSVPQ